MLNHSVAPRECFSFFAEKIRCAIYPPPPGSAPGYHLAHQFTLKKTRNISHHESCDDGMKRRNSAPFASVMRCCSCGTPPTAITAKTASAMTIDILSTNCTTSVHSTDHN